MSEEKGLVEVEKKAVYSVGQLNVVQDGSLTQLLAGNSARAVNQVS